MMSLCEVGEVDDSSKKLNSYVQEEKAMDEQQLQARAIRLANIPFTIPSEQVPVNLPLGELKRGQQDDAQCKRWREMLETWKADGAKGQDKPAEVRGFALTDDGVLMKLGYIGEEGEREVLRPVAPASLRPFIMHNHHGSVFAVHHGVKTTLHRNKSRFWWPKMREEVNQYVSRCKVCQMVKALKPANQRLLRGWRHSMAMNELCMDLVGSISAATGHDKHNQPLYTFVAIDPFTHMIWLECLPAKGGENVFRAFVNRILLEEGAPRIIRCDNGTEFKKSMLNGLCRELHVQMQFSPACWSQGNQCKRLNRYLGETLRCMTNTENGRKQSAAPNKRSVYRKSTLKL